MNKYSVVTYYKLLPYNEYLKSIIKIGFNNNAKGPSFVWYRLSKNTVNKKNIVKRHDFKEDVRLENRFRVTDDDYRKSGFDRGHLASDASFDYSDTALDDVYIYSNIVPQKHKLNAYVWGGFEKYARYITLKLKYAYVVNLVVYSNDTIGANVKVPKVMYKVIINNKNKFLRIFKVKETDTKKGLKRYEISYDKLMSELKK